MSTTADALVHDLVRLLTDDERAAILQGARVRQRALVLAQRLGMRPSPDAVRSAAMSFRRARGLTRADSLAAWCAERNLDAEGFAQLMTEEATLATLGGGEADARGMANFLRVAEGADALWAKAHTLAAQQPPDASRNELLHVWYETRLGRPVPDAERIEHDARAHGFDDTDDLLRALALTTRAVPVSSRALAVGDALPEFVLRHPQVGDVRPDLYAGRWWVLLVTDAAALTRSVAAALDDIEGLAVGVATEVPPLWSALDDAAGVVRARIGLGDTLVALVSPAGQVAHLDDPRDVVSAVCRIRVARQRALERNHAHATAPVLFVHDAFEEPFCEAMMAAWRSGAREEGAVTAESDEGARALRDGSLKRRVDHVVRSAELDAEIRMRLTRRVFPALRRAFQFEVGRCEGFRIGCYEAANGGFFRAHRDDANPATAHRRFALSVNLARGSYDGGRLRLPEHDVTLDAPTGTAVVYAASVLHEVEPVTRGRRFVLVGFFS